MAEVWQVDGNVASNVCYLYPSKSPSTTGLNTNVGTDFPYALSRKMPFRFARGIFFLKHGIGVPVTMLAKEKKTLEDTVRHLKKSLHSFFNLDNLGVPTGNIFRNLCIGHCRIFDSDHFYLSIAGCVVAKKFVSLDLDIAHCFDFACRFFADDFFVC